MNPDLFALCGKWSDLRYSVALKMQAGLVKL